MEFISPEGLRLDGRRPHEVLLSVCVCVCVCVCICLYLYWVFVVSNSHRSILKLCEVTPQFTEAEKIRTLVIVLCLSTLDLSRCEFKTFVSESVRLPRIMCDSRHLDHSWHVQLYVLL
jgi:hypothetical protein